MRKLARHTATNANKGNSRRTLYTMLDSMEPHWASNLKDRIKHVSGAPKKLLAICTAQVGMLFVGFYFGRGGAACALQLHGENDVRIDCNRCRALRGFGLAGLFLPRGRYRQHFHWSVCLNLSK